MNVSITDIKFGHREFYNITWLKGISSIKIIWKTLCVHTHTHKFKFPYTHLKYIELCSSIDANLNSNVYISYYETLKLN